MRNGYATCTDCHSPIFRPWDGATATPEDVHHCAGCDKTVCWECKNMDTAGDDWCEPCADQREAANPEAFAH
jgi:hypothetical protein